MKIKKLVLLCCAAFFTVCAVFLALMRFSDNGALNPASPDRAMQELLDRTGAPFWASAVKRAAISPESTPFEDAIYYRDAALDALSTGILTFERVKTASGEAPAYDLFSDGRRMCSLTLKAAETGWALDRLTAGPELKTRSLTIAVPTGAAVTLNGTALDDTYLSGETSPYDTLTEAENSFAKPPQRAVYTVTGLYDGAIVSASRDGRELIAEPSDSFDMAFTDSLALAVYAPKGAEVLIGGAIMTPTGEGLPFSSLKLPEETAPELYDAYLFEDLRDIPALSASIDGAPLHTLTAQDGSIVFIQMTGRRATEEYAAAAKGYIKSLAGLGTGRVRLKPVLALTLPETELYRYLDRAAPGLIWVHSITLTGEEISVRGFVPLGEDCFLCRARLECTASTYYEKRELALDYELVFVLRDGAWLAADMSCR